MDHFISFSGNSLLDRNNFLYADFCMLILYPATWLNLLIRSDSVLMGSGLGGQPGAASQVFPVRLSGQERLGALQLQSRLGFSSLATLRPAREVSKPSKAFRLCSWLKLTQSPSSLAAWCHCIFFCACSALLASAQALLGYSASSCSPSAFWEVTLSLGPDYDSATLPGQGNGWQGSRAGKVLCLKTSLRQACFPPRFLVRLHHSLGSADEKLPVGNCTWARQVGTQSAQIWGLVISSLSLTSISQPDSLWSSRMDLFSCSPHGVRPKWVFPRSNPQCGDQELNVYLVLSFSTGGTIVWGENHAWYSSWL